MPEDNVNTYHDEDTLKKVYEGLLAAGIFGQQAVDAVNQIQNRRILFREAKPKRRGRPPKSKEDLLKDDQEIVPATVGVVQTVKEKKVDPWTPEDGPDKVASK